MQNLFLVLIFISFYCKGQELIPLKSISVEKVGSVSIDVNNSLYVSNNKGALYQYDSSGKAISVFSPQQPGQIALIEAWRTMNIFVFYRELQKYVILNRFLVGEGLVSIDQEAIAYAQIVAPSSDNNLWVFDNVSFSIKKYNISLQKTVIEAPLDLMLDANHYNLSYIKEYQNRLYLSDSENGILVFDNFGNYLETLPFKATYFNFIGEEMYFLQGQELVFVNLYNGSERKIDVKKDNYKFSLAYSKKVVLFSENQIDFFKVE